MMPILLDLAPKHHAFDFQPTATAPSSASFMGAFGKRLFEQSEFPIAKSSVLI